MYASIYEAEEGLRAVEGPAQVGALPRAASLAPLKVSAPGVFTSTRWRVRMSLLYFRRCW
jgi:hypothetical protein